VIRRANTSDAAACRTVYAPYVTGTASTFETDIPPVEEMARRIGAAKLWLVAERDDEVVGFAYGGTHRSRAAYRWTVETSVYVSRDHERRGVGRELYTALLPDLADRGYRMAVAAISLPNPASVGLHEAVGFVRAGVFRDIGFKAGAWWDVGWWQRALREPGDGPPAEPRQG
jgi:phosphinothricin acetyltransferase